MEWFALGCSLFLLHPRASGNIILLLPMMLVVVIVETAGYYLRIAHHANQPYYNISTPLNIVLLLLLLRRNLEAGAARGVVSRMIPVYILFCLLNCFGPFSFAQHFQNFCSYNYIAGAFCLTVACSVYLYQFIKKPEEQVIHTDEVFWITVAVMCLYAPKSVLFAIFPYFTQVRLSDYSFNETWHLITDSLNMIFYGILSYACVCRLIFRK